MIRCGIVGVSGYTGIELLNLLKNHPNTKVEVLVSQNHVGKYLSEILPNHAVLSSQDLLLEAFSIDRLSQMDVVFFATPHGVSMRYVPDLVNCGVVVIDLSADFRLKNSQIWLDWYDCSHQAKDYLSKAVYGLSEFYKDQIKSASLIACPGCYPTAVNLGLIPLVRNFKVKSVVADCKSGASGAGRQANKAFGFCDVDQNFYAYGANKHRHFPEIQEQLGYFSKENIPDITFVPHMAPMVRGIYATLYIQLEEMVLFEKVYSSYQQSYASSCFVDVLPSGALPRLLPVVKTNGASVGMVAQNDCLIVAVVIDNLLKGASGQAVQNMNIRFGLPEDTGL